MNSLRDWALALGGRLFSLGKSRRRAASRPFRPLAESIEVRTMPSPAAFGAVLTPPAILHRQPAPADPDAMDTVVVNGQVEVQPDPPTQC